MRTPAPLLLCAAAAAAAPHPRRPLRSDIAAPTELAAQRSAGAAPFGHHVTLKFADHVRMRAPAPGRIVSEAGNTSAATEAAAAAARVGASLEPLLGGVAGVPALLRAAEERSGAAQPDLLGLMRVRLPDAAARDGAALVAAARALDALPSVEYVTIGPVAPPPPSGRGPYPHEGHHCHACRRCGGSLSKNVSHLATPDFEPRQEYRGVDPGMDVAWAESDVPGWPAGSGVRWSDIEYSWYYSHEDIGELTRERDFTEVGNFRDHGTACAGIAVGVRNGFGVTGVAEHATAQTFSEQTVEGGHNRPRAVAAAAAASRFGDIVLYEMQTSCLGQRDYVPAECDNSVWLATKAATDAGVVVIAAAGNGDADLDSAAYREYMNRGDSGAIIIGAGEARIGHPKASFSTYGSRVDVQGWGDWSVMATGYGDCRFETGLPYGEHRYYTSTFSGTSSASALVSSAAAALQSHVKARYGNALGPVEMRELLTKTGVPQSGGGHIGPHVNLRRAVEELERRARRGA